MNVHVDVRTEWHGSEAKRRARRALLWWLRAGGILIAQRVRERLSTDGRGLVRGRRVGPGTHSRPGESPYLQTGMLRASIRSETDAKEMETKVGSPHWYGAILELFRNRPFLRVSMQESQAKIEELAQSIPRLISGESIASEPADSSAGGGTGSAAT